MAPKQTAKKTSAPPPARKPSRGYAEQIESAEVRRSRKSAILQLSMGRLAHVLGIASGLALAATAVLAYLLVNWDYLADAPEYVMVLKWLVPLLAGVTVGTVALVLKWEPYFADRDEPHFIMSIVAVAVPAVFTVLIVLDEMGKYALGRPDWLYPVSLLGISLTMISLAMTWEGTGRRKMISIAAAIFPPALLIFPMIVRFTDVELASILPMAYLGSAVAIQLSGSMLHIIASSTTVLQREVLKASDGKLKEQTLELEKKRKALEYREDALRSKESDLEAYESRLSEELAAVDARKSMIASLEKELEQRVELAKSSRQELTKSEVSAESKLETLRLKQAEIDAQVRDIDRRTKAIAERESRISSKESEASKLVLDARATEREAKNRLAEVQAEESSLQTRMKQLESLKSSLLERERQISARESTMDVKAMEVTSAKEQQLSSKAAALASKEIELRSKEESLRKEAEKAQRLIDRADRQMNELVEKEQSVLVREKSLADKEASLRASLENVNAQLEDMQRSKSMLSEREKEYHSLSQSTRTKLAEMTSRDEETARRMAALDRREENVKELDRRLKEESERMNAKLRELLEKEKDMHAKEAEIGLRHAEIKAREREVLEHVQEVDLARAEMPVQVYDEQAKTLEVRERHLAEKEREIKARLYQREKELEKREHALRDRLKRDVEEMEEAVEEEYAEEKVKTGIERLDDLLMGGIPFASNTLYIGPPFIGKEVASLLFLSEGLKKGVPCVIITTSRSPADVAKDMAPIMPTFMEFENLGLVHWIDASGPQADAGAAQQFSNVHRVKGPDDFAGITAAVDGCIKGFERQEHPYFRLVYLSLSMSVTQAEEKRSFQFIQGLAGRIRQARGVAVYAIEKGMHTEQQLESVQHQMTGAVIFKTEKQKTLLSVQGIGDVQTRDWIDYRHTNKAIMIGAFSLERIR